MNLLQVGQIHVQINRRVGDVLMPQQRLDCPQVGPAILLEQAHRLSFPAAPPFPPPPARCAPSTPR